MAALLCLALLPLLSAALRLTDNPPEHLEYHRSTQELQGLPPVEVLRPLWWDRARKEPLSPLPPDVQLVLGVFTYRAQSRAHEVRQILKETWLERPGICWLPEGQRPGCGVYAAFVLGGGQPAQAPREELVLNITESVNGGKSYEFFRYASRAYPWATHFAKMDTDTFPYIRRLAWSLQKHMAGGCEHYVGRAVDFSGCGRKRDICPPEQCGSPVLKDFLNFQTALPESECWSYMHGGLYVMSTRLATGVSERNGLWDKNKVGYEDLLTGKAVTQYGRQHALCISTWNPLAWDHVRYWWQPKYLTSVADKWALGVEEE